MQVPRLDFVTCANPAGLHRMAYWEWGDPDNDKVLLCVHGLTRSGRDFDAFAHRLSAEYRVICPDVAGRGHSDWLPNPAFYTIPQYVADMVTLLARLRPATLHWVGTSMGGLIGMALAGAAALGARHPAPPGLLQGRGWHVDKLVLNDVGPHLEPPALGRILQYVAEPASFETLAAAQAYVRSVSAAFGPHTDAQWEALTRNVYREQDGRWIKHYDLRLAAPFSVQNQAALAAGEHLLWQAYEAIDAPMLILRGEHSDLLSPATVREMARRNPRARSLVVPEAGHAPTLMSDAQIAPVAAFLLQV